MSRNAPLTIALDYDGTFTELPLEWTHALQILKNSGAVIVGVTMRYEDEKDGMHPKYFEVCDVVHFTGGRAKATFCEEHNIPIDIWVDDRPDFILEDAL